jgi:hypothetical protein
MRSSRNGDPFNNYSTRGNVNPYTGVPGTHDPYRSTYGGGCSPLHCGATVATMPPDEITILSRLNPGRVGEGYKPLTHGRI